MPLTKQCPKSKQKSDKRPNPPQPLQPVPSPSTILSHTRTLIAEYIHFHNEVVRTVTPSTANFGNTILPLIQADERDGAFPAMVSCLWYSAPDQETRDAAQEARKLWREADSELSARRDLYELVKAAVENEKASGEQGLDEEDKLLMWDMVRDYENSGHGVLDDEGREELMRSWLEIGDLAEEFKANLVKDEGGVWFTEEELEGVKEDKIQSFKLGTEEDGENKGKRFVTWKADYGAVVNWAKRRETRKRYIDEEDQKLGENLEIFKKVFDMRAVNAKKLGFKSHAEYRLKDRMAGSPAWVEAFNQSLKEGLEPIVQKDMERVRGFWRAHLKENPEFGGDGDEVPREDKGYIRRWAEAKDNIDHDKISEWFPVEYTVKAMLNMFSDFFGIVFVPLPKEELVGKIWHEEVEVFSVWEEGEGDSVGDFIGYLYTDLLFRDGKCRGNQNTPLGSVFFTPDGTRSYPATVLTCSTPRTTSAPCPLLKRREVVTVFHELGHGIHDLLSRTKYRRFHSWNGPQSDFCEGPSMFLEYFCWLPSEMRQMSCHYTRLPNHPEYLTQWREKNPEMEDPPEKIPEETLTELVRRRYIDQGLWWAGQLGVSIFDMRITNPPSREELQALDLAAVYDEIFRELIPWKRTPEELAKPKGNAHVHFGHLIKGMDAGYYAYQWAGVFAADVFDTMFAANPRDRKTWERYRRTILQPGGSVDAKKMIEEFLGRPVNPDALMRRLRAAE
ncbi:peptidase family M3 [Cercophora newfieldiana]|uniref:Peptidase family M3 n=1 Tax=Cercophora newfieldiana TaxID=92897 RepID=A0AA39Y8A5_9PEZI|nr:peptidase family M3 [Cercophora newfieldiana]